MPDPETVGALVKLAEVAAAGVIGKDVVKAVLLPPAGEVGEVLRLAVRRALSGVRRFLLTPEELDAWVSTEVARRLAAVPPERIQAPAPEVVVPALTAVAYTQAEELRAMFANLLAKSMDSATAGDVHPSFVEVVKQLRPDEAKILKVLRPEAEFYDVYQIRHFEERGSMKHEVFHALTTLFDRAGTKRSLVSIDNITRQRLAEFATHLDSYTERFDILTPNDIDQYSAMMKVFDEEGPAMRTMLARQAAGAGGRRAAGSLHLGFYRPLTRETTPLKRPVLITIFR